MGAFFILMKRALFFVGIILPVLLISTSAKHNVSKREAIDKKAAIELGKKLFYDPIMSRDCTISCSSCHKPELAFTDGLKTSIGIKGRVVSRNSPTLANFENQPYFLLDGVNNSLESQVTVPIQEHTEFDFHILLLVERLKKDSLYLALSLKAYGEEPSTVVITHSIAEFERTIVSNNSAFDKYKNGDTTALNNSQLRGKNIFFEKLYCGECHNQENLTDYSLTNNGLYEVYADSGRMRKTELEKDRAIFKVPTLRNIELTAPYMHDGSLSNLNDVISHYSSGGKEHKNKSEIIKPFSLTEQEKEDLINFLKSLTDYDFLTNPEYKIN